MVKIEFEGDKISDIGKWYQEYKKISKEVGREPESMGEWIYNIVSDHAERKFYGKFEVDDFDDMFDF